MAGKPRFSTIPTPPHHQTARDASLHGPMAARDRLPDGRRSRRSIEPVTDQTAEALPSLIKGTPTNMTDLKSAARAAFITDPDVLLLADKALAPVAAVADLNRRFPQAFTAVATKPVHVRDMDAAELVEAKRRIGLRITRDERAAAVRGASR